MKIKDIMAAIGLAFLVGVALLFAGGVVVALSIAIPLIIVCAAFFGSVVDRNHRDS